MKHYRIIAFLFAAMTALPALGQEVVSSGRLDTLIGKGQYATAYALAQTHYRQAQERGGAELLEAAFFLTAIDYAYSKSPEDSALMRYSLLTRRLRGVDRAVAYTFLYQTYSMLYDRAYYRVDRKKSSDDPNLSYTQWHRARWEDTLSSCVDSVLAYAGELRAESPRFYSTLLSDKDRMPVADTSLLGMVVQALLTTPQLARADDSTSFLFNLHQRVAQLYAGGTADMMLWLDLQRLNSCYYVPEFLAAVDSLALLYLPCLQSDEMRALLNQQRARYLSYELRKVEAERLCLETEQAYPGTYGAQACRELRRDICKPGYEVKYNNTESSRRSRMAMVESRNIEWLDFRIVQQDLVSDSVMRIHPDTLLSLPAVKAWRQALPDPGDHLMHRYLVALPPVPQGDYYLALSTDSSFCYDDYRSVDAAFIPYYLESAAGKYTHLSPSSGHLVDRLTGHPLAGKQVTLELEGDLTYRDHHRRCRTDKEGYFHFPTSSARYGLMHAEDITADVDGYEYSYHSTFGWYSVESTLEEGRRKKMLDIVMTDRPIYRLGDTVHFSCVAYKKKERGAAWDMTLKPSSGVKLMATFGEDYGQTKDTLWLTTDKHGRCWGEFVVPADGRNGYYRLEVESPGSYRSRGYHSERHVKVEAYKPPHFMVTLSTTDGDAASDTGSVHRFGQPITVYGTAMSYSGAPMTGAKVKWEVSRERMVDPLQSNSVANDFPYHDSLTVGDDGLFQFSFTPEKDSGTVIYIAYARVTDADGELHEQQLAFRVSDRDGYCMLNGDDLSQLTFVYNNFDHQPLKGAVRVELYQLRQPDTLRTLDPLMVQYPDAQWVGTREEFYRAFPYRAFSRQEGDSHAWPVVAKRYDETTDGRQLDIDGLPSGMYRVRFTAPDGGVHDTLVNHVARGGRVTGDDVVWLRTTPKSDWNYFPTLTCREGDTVRFELGSPYGNQPLYYCVSHAAKVYQRGMMVLDSSHASTLAIPITRKMKEGCVVTLTAMREGRTYATQWTVRVLRPEQQLVVQTETFRDRLQPGEHEQWRLRITSADTLDGKSAKGVEANLCLTMYDQSLEQYEWHRYGFRPWDRRYQELRRCLEEKYVESSVGLWKGNLDSHASTALVRPLFGFALPNLSDYYKQLVLQFNPGTIRGTVTDAKTKEALPFVNVLLKKDGVQVAGGTTDFDGYYTIKGVPEGEYDLEVNTVGYSRLTQRVVVRGRNMIIWNISLSSTATNLECVEIVEEKIPCIEIGAPESGTRISADDIARMPGNSVESIVAAVGGIGYSDGGMVTMQAGVRKRTGVMAPKEAIAEVMPILNFEGSAGENNVRMRKNLSTLALFEPALRSDKKGRVEVSFQMPDALTQWQLHGFAWTDDFQVGTLDRTLQTQKELMVQPLLPRFLRQGDTTEIRAKVSNLTESAMSVKVTLGVENGEWKAESKVAAHSSAVVTFRVPVGSDWHVANYRIIAHNADATQDHLSDGEQGQLPVLSNRERITESRLLYIAGTTDSTQPKTADYQFPILNSQFSISFTANPMEYAIQALPHFERHRMPGNLYLANSIFVNHLSSQLSPLTEKERKRLTGRVRSDMMQLLKNQNSGGGWSWMPDGRMPSLYITEAILQRLTTCPSLAGDNYYKRYYQQALSWLDKAVVRQYQESPNANLQLSTLYTRSLYLDVKPLEQCDSLTRVAYDYYYRQCKMKAGSIDMKLYSTGQLTLLMLHMGDTAEAVELANRIKEAAHVDEQQGMYWVSNTSGYGWYQRPVETASLMVDVFADVLHDWESVNRVQQWILTQKQATAWKTDMTTAHAVAALVRQSPWSASAPAGTNRQAFLTVNGQPYKEFDSVSDASVIFQFSTLNFQLSNPSPYPAWGAVFMSRELPLDSIPYNGTGISLRKTLSLVDADGSLHLLDSTAILHVGDRVRIHIDVYCERDMDNMVLSDQRASAFEPVSTNSGWQWNDGLRYYVDMRDDRADCYIDRLREGHYYVEYDVWVRHAGTFTNGIGILRSVYAPEFRANTPSAKLRVAD